MIISSPIDAPGISAAFFTREGGVSEGLYAALNCGYGSGDDPQAVRENRRRAMEKFELSPEALATLYQVHSPTVVEVEKPWRPGEAPQADGMVTTRRGLALGILTADCAPVLFADAEAGVIGAAHAGWRGAFTGVLEQTVAGMARLGASPAKIRAAIGPCISQASYEVGPEFHERFIAADADNAAFFGPSKRPSHHQFDLSGLCAATARNPWLGRNHIGRRGHRRQSNPLFQLSPRDTRRREGLRPTAIGRRFEGLEPHGSAFHTRRTGRSARRRVAPWPSAGSTAC